MIRITLLLIEEPESWLDGLKTNCLRAAEWKES